MEPTFFERIKSYVGFKGESSAALLALHPLAQPHFASIVDDFYAAIEADPDARAAITGGPAQIERLKQTLIRWLELMLLGPHDEAYYQVRTRIGRVHVRIGLPQAFMFTAMNRIRVRLADVVRDGMADDPAACRRTETALHQILDLELAIMLETYREDLLAKNGTAERLATIGQFSASIGHELRNPLGVIESSLFLLRQHLGPEVVQAPGVDKHLNRIGGEVKRASKTIADLLDLAGNRPPRRQVTHLRELVESAARAALLPTAVTVTVASTPDDVAIEVDPDQLRQVFVNLFVNAAQATPDGCHVQVQGQPLPSGACRIRVRDDGPGVPVDVRHRIFEALFTTKARGSGLGLALCRRIMEAHGGSIELEPSDCGAAFALVVPPATNRASAGA